MLMINAISFEENECSKSCVTLQGLSLSLVSNFGFHILGLDHAGVETE